MKQSEKQSVIVIVLRVCVAIQIFNQRLNSGLCVLFLEEQGELFTLTEAISYCLVYCDLGNCPTGVESTSFTVVMTPLSLFL